MIVKIQEYIIDIENISYLTPINYNDNCAHFNIYYKYHTNYSEIYLYKLEKDAPLLYLEKIKILRNKLINLMTKDLIDLDKEIKNILILPKDDK